MMKHIAKIFFLLFFASVSVYAQYKVPLIDSYSGNKHVVAYLNGVKVNFVFDTGCSGISVNRNIFEQLVANGSLKKESLSAPKESELADGRTHLVQKFIVGTFKIGGFSTSGVIVQVGVDDSPNAQPLLGQGFLMLLENYKVENNHLIFTPKEVAERETLLKVEALEMRQDSTNTKELVALLKPLYEKRKLSCRHLSILADALYDSKDYELALECYEMLSDSSRYMKEERIVHDMALTRIRIGDKYYDARNYDKAIEIYKGELLRPELDQELKGYLYYSLFLCHISEGDWGSAKQYGDKGIAHILHKQNLTLNDLQSKYIKHNAILSQIIREYIDHYAEIEDYENAAYYKKIYEHIKE